MPLDAISPNPRQPRTRFDPEELRSLADSIRQYGLLQPVIVTLLEDGRCELVSGERRLRAAKLAGMKEVSAIVRKTKDHEKLELALIENIQRQDLNPIERAQSYNVLIKEFSLTQEEAAQRLGIARSIIANSLRYLELPLKAKEALMDGKITEGHAKIIASLPTEEEQKKVLEAILEQHYTVRETDTFAKARRKAPSRSTPTLEGAQDQEMLRELRQALGTKVEITHRGEGGTIAVYYYSAEELRELVEKIALANLPSL